MAAPRDIRRWPALACRSLLLVAVLLFAPACLDASPEYSVPGRIPPVLDTDRVVPPSNQINLIDRSNDVEFNVPFRSEDNGEPLVAHLLLDLAIHGPNATSVAFADVDPSPLPFSEQEGRAVTITWPGIKPTGCHTITLILNHADNRARNSIFLPLDASLAAFETWYFGVTDGQSQDSADISLTDCPPNPGGM